MPTLDRRRLLTAAASGAFALSTLDRTAFAETDSGIGNWPKDHIIRAVVPFGAGSTIDVIGRIVLDPLAQQLGQTIIVENRGGAGGSIGAADVAKTAADGYTLLVNAAAHTAAPAVYPNLSYDPSKDFAGVAVFGVVPNVLLIAPSKGINSAKELVERGKDGSLTFASAGVGSATHWAAERFLVAAGIKATHVPFTSGPAALTEVMTGRVDFCFIGTSSSLPFITDHRLLALAVSSTRRSPVLPDVPTTVELGYSDSAYTYWNGLLVAAKTPRPIVDRLHTEVTKALALQTVKDKLAAQGLEPMPLSPQEFDAMIAKEITANIALAKAAGLKFN
ncbi:MAG TPA: tripartite tricarboxylate transporter substrate-binding protein [Xanthobacteraceae bacterium]|jgi:tripartite-type tricarboxylate transporter receptor subunit TctC|nr:tripartite tricarboxylate transporter substrate-binding protein [Xanthobacteraceae bacterium]